MYKGKGVKSFEIRGAQHQNIKVSESQRFIGYVKTEDNDHDRYAIAIYKNPNKKIGYVPRGNIRLNKSLQEWHNGETLAWGYLYYSDRSDRWIGEVNIPIGLNQEEIDVITNILTLQEHIHENVVKNDLSIADRYEVLEMAYEIYEKRQ